MAINSVPYPNQDYQLDVSWPLLTGVQVGSAFLTTGNPKYGIGNAYTMYSAPTGAGVNNMGLYKGVLAGQFVTNGAGATIERTVDGCSMYVPLNRNGSSAGMKFGAEVRVWRFSTVMAVTSGVSLSTQTGIAIEPANATAPGWIDGGNRGFGVLGNPGGGWQYVEKNAGGVGVYQFTRALTWPSPLTDWVTVDFEIVSASGAGDAVMNLYLDNTLVLQRSWAAGASSLPTYASPANAARFVPHIRCGEPGVVEQLEIAAGQRYMAGLYTLAGALV